MTKGVAFRVPNIRSVLVSFSAPAYPNRRPQRVHNLEANTGLQHPLSTLHERRRRLPCKTRFRLAGCASTGRVSNPLDRFERFQVTSHSPFQDLSCRKGGLCQAALWRTRRCARLPVPLHPPDRYCQTAGSSPSTASAPHCQVTGRRLITLNDSGRSPRWGPTGKIAPFSNAQTTQGSSEEEQPARRPS